MTASVLKQNANTQNSPKSPQFSLVERTRLWFDWSTINFLSIQTSGIIQREFLVIFCATFNYVVNVYRGLGFKRVRCSFKCVDFKLIIKPSLVI